MNTVDQQLFDYASNMARHAEAFAHLRDVLAAVASSDQHVTELKAQIVKLQAEVEAAEQTHDARIKQLDQQYIDYQAQHNVRLESVVNQVNSQIKAKDAELLSLDSQLKSLQSSVDNKREELSSFSSSVHDSIASLQATKAALEADIASLKAKHGL